MAWQCTFHRSLLTGVGLAMASQAFANGINPPRTADSHPLQGTCVAWDGEIHRLLRVRLDAVEGDRLSVKRGAGLVMLAVGDVKELTLQKRKPDRNGELVSTLTRNDGSAPEVIRIVASVHGNPVRIVGFTGGTSAESIPVSECRRLSFERQRDECARPGEPTAAAPGGSSASSPAPVGAVRPATPGCDEPPDPAKRPTKGR